MLAVDNTLNQEGQRLPWNTTTLQLVSTRRAAQHVGTLSMLINDRCLERRWCPVTRRPRAQAQIPRILATRFEARLDSLLPGLKKVDARLGAAIY